MVSERDVTLLFSVVTPAGLIIGYLISPAALLVVLVVWAVGCFYSWRGKQAGPPGNLMVSFGNLMVSFANLMVSFSVGMTLIFGGLVAGDPLFRPSDLLIYDSWRFSAIFTNFA